MTDQEINIKIAEYMGYTVSLHGEYMMDKGSFRQRLHDYCHDLNAVWEVEEKLKAEGKQIDYVLIISAPYEALFQAAHATARQRCEAIIKVLEGLE